MRSNIVAVLEIKTLASGQSFTIPSGASGIVIENNGSANDVVITSPNSIYGCTWTLKAGQSLSPSSLAQPFDEIVVTSGTSTVQIAFVN